MQKQLSSPATVLWKIIFPAIWISGWGAGTAALWFGAFHGRDNQPPPESMRWIFLSVWLVASTILIWFSRRLHRVSLNDGTLIASNFFRKVSIPVTAISRVTQSSMTSPMTISIDLDHDTLLGRRIVFIPVGRARSLSEHPTTIELKALMARSHNAHHGNASSHTATNTPAITDFRGVLFLKWLVAAAGVLLVVSVVTGISSYQASPERTVVTYHTVTSRIVMLALAPLYFAFFYGLHRRSYRAWRAGFGFLILGYIWIVFAVWRGSSDMPGMPRILPIAFAALGGAAVTAHWWAWWKRQRGYFADTPTGTSSGAEASDRGGTAC